MYNLFSSPYRSNFKSLTYCILNKLVIAFRKPVTKPHRIALLKFLGIGSIVMAYPAYRSLRKSYPDAKIDIITFENNRQLFEMLKMGDAIHTIRAESLLDFIVDFPGLAATLALKRYDACVDLEFFSIFANSFVFYLSTTENRLPSKRN